MTGRSVRGQPTTLGRPGTIDATEDEVTAREYGYTGVGGKQQSALWHGHWA